MRSWAAHVPRTSTSLQLRHEPDVIIANFGPNGIPAARLKACFFPKSKLVVVFHGYDMSSYITRYGWQSYRDMAQLVDLAICVNTRWAECIRRETNMRNVVTLHLGVHCDQMPSRRKLRAGKFSILFAGRMTEKKGFDQLIEAISILRDKKVPVLVHAIGDGLGLSDSRSLISALGLENEFVIYGAREHDFVLKLMSEVDCFVAPSITARNGDQEGIPVALMEAMAIGTPVISTRHSGIPELIVEGESGLLVDERVHLGQAPSRRRTSWSTCSRSWTWNTPRSTRARRSPGCTNRCSTTAATRCRRSLTCLHEESAMAMAHGYAKAAGKPMLVCVHGVVGLLHSSMALFQAWADRVPVIVIVGHHRNPSGVHQPPAQRAGHGLDRSRLREVRRRGDDARAVRGVGDAGVPDRDDAADGAGAAGGGRGAAGVAAAGAGAAAHSRRCRWRRRRKATRLPSAKPRVCS